MNDRTPTEAKLLPCPFCGGEGERIDAGPAYGLCHSEVRCTVCEARTTSHVSRSAENLHPEDDWNRRASPPAPAAEPVAEVIHAARGHDPSEKEITAYGKPYGAWADTLKIVEAIKPYLTHPLDAAAIRAEARREALEEAERAIGRWHRSREPNTAAMSNRLARELMDRHHLIGAVVQECQKAICALADKGEAEGWRPTHQHVKRGTTYRVIGEAEAQVSMAGRSDFPATARLIGDGDKLTVYQGEDGKLWARFTDEFNDGRFAATRAALPQEDGG